MYEGNKVELHMEKTVILNVLPDELSHNCKVLRYDPEEDYIRLLLEKDENLQAISLDAKYRCDVTTKTEILSCNGVIKERYHDADGNILIFKIENGFYSTQKVTGK